MKTYKVELSGFELDTLDDALNALMDHLHEVVGDAKRYSDPTMVDLALSDLEDARALSQKLNALGDE